MVAPSSESPEISTRQNPPDLELVPPDPHADGTVSEASRRLRALAALSGSLTDALSPEIAADLVEKKALSALHATSAIVVTLGDFPPKTTPAEAPAQAVPMTLHVVHAIGLPAELRAALEEKPLDAPLPFADVARDGEAVYLASPHQMRRYPEWGDAMIGAGARAAAIVPVWANGELRGVLGLAWPEPRIFDEDEQAFVATLGVMCAQAIMRAHLKAAELAARQDAERANKSKAHFVATISHELRTPINAVVGYTDLVTDGIDGPITPRQMAHLGRVRESATHLLGLVDDLQGFARVEAGEETVRAEPVQLLVAIEQSLRLVRPIAEKKGLQMRVVGHDSPLELYTDPRKLRQVLVNLLANAVKFTELGEVVLLVRVSGEDPAARVVLEVRDTGRGIADPGHPHVFDPFWQANPDSPTSAGSTGLGLSVARQLARLLGGDVVMTASVMGKGSTFELSLPLHYRPAAAAAP